MFQTSLIDNPTQPPNNPNETWDRVQGVTICQMYLAHGSDVINRCSYRLRFIVQNPQINANDLKIFL